jgi:hypothetical protein
MIEPHAENSGQVPVRLVHTGSDVYEELGVNLTYHQKRR